MVQFPYAKITKYDTSQSYKVKWPKEMKKEVELQLIFGLMLGCIDWSVAIKVWNSVLRI